MQGDDPIAIVGLACRFPGARDAGELWKLLVDGVDAVTEVPRDRWDPSALAPDGASANTAARWGGFIDGVEYFDGDLFRIAQNVGAATDPQQRLLLEVAWEALEDACLDSRALAGTATGVFVGISQYDYGAMLLGAAATSPFAAAGGSLAMAAARIAYAFDFQGPAMSIDTACSSSLVALHQACQSIRTGESTVALVGGANLMLSPQKTIALSSAGFLSPDGRCKAFDASANGYVRSEGIAVVVLKSLTSAMHNGNRVYAVIRGTAVGQDGRSNGIHAPNGRAQQRLVRAALAEAGVPPSDVSYVEAHGTGTSLGDPVEVRSLAAVLAEGRASTRRCAIGSVKSNIGHLEAAAGLAGVIKTALCLHHGVLVPSIHFHDPNPHIPFAELAVKVQTQTEAWPGGSPRVAGVSSFGGGGTIAHAVMAEAPARPAPGGAAEGGACSSHLLLLSGASDGAVRALADKYATYLDSRTSGELGDICYTAASGRTHLSHRLAVFGRSSKEMLTRLREHATGAAPARTAHVVMRTPKIAFLFTGQGAQYVGMARELYEAQPTFRRALDRCAELLEGTQEPSLLDVMFADRTGEALLDQTIHTQTALFALGYSLAELWRSWGIKPHALLGHSVGEITAACVAGVFSLTDGIRLVAARGRLMQSLQSRGAMLAVSLAPERVMQFVDRERGEVDLAAINGDENVVLSGPTARLDDLAERLERANVPCKRLNVSHAFHSTLMDPILDAFEAVVAQLELSRPRIPIVSNVTGQLISEELCTAMYWRRHLRETVRFRDGMLALVKCGCAGFIELGPGTTLLAMGQASIPKNDGLVWAASLRKSCSDREQLLQSLGDLYCKGIEADWREVERPYGRSYVAVPFYPFQRVRHSLENAPQHEVVVALQRSKENASNGGGAPAAGASAMFARVLRALGPIGELPPDTTLDAAGIDSLWLSDIRSSLTALPGGAELAGRLRTTSRLGEIFELLEQTNTDCYFDVDGVLVQLARAEWIDATLESVNKRSADNVLLRRGCRIELNGLPVHAVELRSQTSHSFFYDRELDHVPGLYLIEAARQFGSWIRYLTEGRLEQDGVLHRVEAEFLQFVEHDGPAYLVETEAGGPRHLLQGGKTKAVFRIAGRRIPALEYERLRSLQQRGASR